MTSSQTKPFNRQRTINTAVCAVLLLALSLAIIVSAAPAFADTWSLSAKPNSATYVQGKRVTITGTLTDTTTGVAGSNSLVTVFVYDSAGKLAYSTIVATGTADTYSTQFRISSTNPNGTYTISGRGSRSQQRRNISNSQGNLQCRKHSNANPNRYFIVFSITNAQNPRVSHQPLFFIILLIASATAILFCKRRKI